MLRLPVAPGHGARSVQGQSCNGAMHNSLICIIAMCAVFTKRADDLRRLGILGYAARTGLATRRLICRGDAPPHHRSGPNANTHAANNGRCRKSRHSIPNTISLDCIAHAIVTITTEMACLNDAASTMTTSGAQTHADYAYSQRYRAAPLLIRVACASSDGQHLCSTGDRLRPRRARALLRTSNHVVAHAALRCTLSLHCNCKTTKTLSTKPELHLAIDSPP